MSCGASRRRTHSTKNTVLTARRQPWTILLRDPLQSEGCRTEWRLACVRRCFRSRRWRF